MKLSATCKQAVANADVEISQEQGAGTADAWAGRSFSSAQHRARPASCGTTRCSPY